MKKILFVDDEPKVLQGLQRMLRQMRKEWDMHFVESGQDALESLTKNKFDVVVSDMRMPGMDGAQLLTTVMQQYPKVVRIILSGHSDKELILRSIGPTHQYLAKPCDAQMLKDTITRACALRELLSNETLKDLVTSIKALPSLPSSYVEIVEEVGSEDASMKKIGDIIEKDVGMTAKILQLVNSAFFGLPRHIASPSQAVSLLGLDTIKALVLSVQVFSQFEGSPVEKRLVEQLFHHCTTVGAYARLICLEEESDEKTKDDSFMAGMLHQIGLLILAANLPDLFTKSIAKADADNSSLFDAEREIIGSTHGELGAYLLGLWGFPDPIVEAVAFYNFPRRCLSQIFCPLTAVHAANVIDLEQQETPIGKTPELDMVYLEDLGLAGRLPVWRKICQPLKGEDTHE